MMINQILDGKKIAVIVESEFIPEEIEAYKTRFAEYGATVHLMSRLWGNQQVRFISDVDRLDKSIKYLDVDIDFNNVNIEDYAAVIMSANYTSVRLRYFQSSSQVISPEETRTAPAVSLFAQVMANPKIIKGFLCHGLWILTPMPELLQERRVICHEVVLADIANAGAIYVPSLSGIVTDRDMVTGRSGSDVYAFIEAITEQIILLK